MNGRSSPMISVQIKVRADGGRTIEKLSSTLEALVLHRRPRRAPFVCEQDHDVLQQLGEQAFVYANESKAPELATKKPPEWFRVSNVGEVERENEGQASAVFEETGGVGYKRQPDASGGVHLRAHSVRADQTCTVSLGARQVTQANVRRVADHDINREWVHLEEVAQDRPFWLDNSAADRFSICRLVEFDTPGLDPAQAGTRGLDLDCTKELPIAHAWLDDPFAIAPDGPASHERCRLGGCVERAAFALGSPSLGPFGDRFDLLPQHRRHRPSRSVIRTHVRLSGNPNTVSVQAPEARCVPCYHRAP